MCKLTFFFLPGFSFTNIYDLRVSKREGDDYLFQSSLQFLHDSQTLSLGISQAITAESLPNISQVQKVKGVIMRNILLSCEDGYANRISYQH